MIIFTYTPDQAMVALSKLLGACTFNHADEALARWLLMVPDFFDMFQLHVGDTHPQLLW